MTVIGDCAPLVGERSDQRGVENGGVDVSARRVFVGTLLAAGVLLPPALAVGTDFCENLNSQITIIGEARYLTINQTDECYANVYWDGGDELSLSGFPGGASTAATNLGFHATTHTVDVATQDCTDLTYDLTFRRSNSTSGSNCPSSFQSSSLPFVVNSCGPPESTNDFVVAGKTFGSTGFPYRAYWEWILDVNTGAGCTATDSGCARVLDSTACTLDNY